jgi:HK97 family phage portal protein
MSTRFSTLRKTIATWLAPELKFTPASSEVNWQRIETLVHGPGASDYLYGSDVFNTAVLACLFAISTAYTEPPLTVYRKLTGGKVEELPDQPLQALLDQPTPENQLTIDEIRFWLAWAKHTDGNAYLIKVRSGDERTGNVVELWPVSPTQLSPYTEPGSGDWITHYRYQVKPGVYRPIPVENVIHLKAGLDDRDMRRGISRLKHLVRQITSDNEAEKFTATLLGNYAVPGLVVWPTNGGAIDPDDADRISAKLRQKFGGENRGNIAVMSKESRVEQFGFSPDQINMPGVHNHAEERISGVMGIPALAGRPGGGLAEVDSGQWAAVARVFHGDETRAGVERGRAQVDGLAQGGFHQR